MTPKFHSYPREMKHVLTQILEHECSRAIDDSAKVGKPKSPPRDECVNKTWYSHTMEYYLTIKRNKLLIHAWTWIIRADEPKNVLRERSRDKMPIL